MSVDFVERIYETFGKDDVDRISILPALSGQQLEQLKQLFCPRQDGDVLSKSLRSELVDLGLAARWNGWNFLTQAGYCVLDTLKMLPHDTPMMVKARFAPSDEEILAWFERVNEATCNTNNPEAAIVAWVKDLIAMARKAP